jgi:hypothetical protein
MADERAIEILNRLLDAEQASFIQRLGEACPFVSAAEVATWAVVGELAAASARRQGELTQVILELRGSPVPPRRSADTTSIHYVKLSFLMPKIIAALRDLIGEYASAGRTGYAEADAVIAGGVAEYKRYLAEISKSTSSSTSVCGI